MVIYFRFIKVECHFYALDKGLLTIELATLKKLNDIENR